LDATEPTALLPRSQSVGAYRNGHQQNCVCCSYAVHRLTGQYCRLRSLNYPKHIRKQHGNCACTTRQTAHVSLGFWRSVWPCLLGEHRLFNGWRGAPQTKELPIPITRGEQPNWSSRFTNSNFSFSACNKPHIERGSLPCTAHYF
jgi:hypothetical protein